MIIPDEVKRLARAGKDKKIHAIHALRRATGLGLAEAKEIVETIAAGGEVQLATPPPIAPSHETREQRLERQLEPIRQADQTQTISSKEIIGKPLEILQADEDLLGFAQATYENRGGLLLATQRRLIFVCKERSFGPKMDTLFDRIGFKPIVGNVETTSVLAIKEEFVLDNIYLVHHRAGLHESSIKLFISDYIRAEFTNMDKAVAKTFANKLKSRIEFRKDEIGQFGPEDHLEQVEALYENNIISKEEFANYRRKLMGQINRLNRRHEGPSRPS